MTSQAVELLGTTWPEPRELITDGRAGLLDELGRGFARLQAEAQPQRERKWFGDDTSAPKGRWAGSVGDALIAAIAVVLVLAAWLRSLRAAVKRQTAALRESEERFRLLFEETEQAISLLADGRFESANKASLAMLGLERLDQLVGKTPADLSPPVQANGRDTNELAQEFIRAAFAKGSAKFEWLYLRGDGRPITVQVLFTAIRRGDRQLLHVVWSDITAQQQLERELAEHRTQLEQKVAQRTAELRS